MKNDTNRMKKCQIIINRMCKGKLQKDFNEQNLLSGNGK